MPPGDFSTSIRPRIGAPLIDDPMLCPKCGNVVLSRSASHALCCVGALGESTKFRSKIRDSVLALVRIADSSAEPEVPGLIPDAPTLRSADIFTEAAVPGCQAALDIGVMSPDATGAGADCCESMFQRKLGVYSEHLLALSAQGIRYKPLIVSCDGRAHLDTTATLETIAVRAAHRKGFLDHRLLAPQLENMSTFFPCSLLCHF